MNKAFTKESDDSFDDVVPEPKDLLPSGVKNYVTPEGAEQLRSELKYLTDVERPRVVTGDVREVGPVGDAKAAKRRRLDVVDRRIRFLRDRVNNMELVDPKVQKADRVRFGASVKTGRLHGGTILQDPGLLFASFHILLWLDSRQVAQHLKLFVGS